MPHEILTTALAHGCAVSICEDRSVGLNSRDGWSPCKDPAVGLNSDGWPLCAEHLADYACGLLGVWYSPEVVV